MTDKPSPTMTGPAHCPEFYPRVLPVGWNLAEERHDGRGWVKYLPSKLHWSVIMSFQVELDGRLWIHLSTAMNKRLPTWQELVTVRDIWLPKRKCIQVLAPPDEHVNLNTNCLHLWYCPSGDPLPDFTQSGGSI